jgi:ketosteroid isomerase-like protein
MSRENVEIVRRIYEGWAQGDFSVGSDVLAPDFEWRQSRHAVEPGSVRGSGVGDALRNLFEVYESFRIEAEEYIDLGDKVVVVARSRGRARGSGMDMNQRFAYVWTVRDGQLVRNETFVDRASALEAAGRG